MPRRARHLIATDLPHRGEVMAACGVLILLAHLLLAQLTLGLAVVFAVIGHVSRWRLWWLTVPAAAGLAWALAVGPGHAAGGFAAGPAQVVGYLGHGHLIERLSHPLVAFAGVGRWLPEQLPIALISGAAEAALIGWLDWLHTDEWEVPPSRPGLVAAARRALAAHVIRAGSVVTRDGCALGVVAATGAVAELRWSEVVGGVLVVGAAAQEVTVTGLQVVHAALRRRKPLIVLDLGGQAAIATALTAACTATGTPLRVAGAVDLGRVIRERSAALLPADSPERGARACADIAALAADLRRIGVDGDALIWVTGGERMPGQALAALIRDARGAGLAVLIAAAASATVTDLAGLVAALLIHGISDPSVATSLAARTGVRLLPASASAAASAAAAQTGGRAGVAGPPMAPPGTPARGASPGPVMPTDWSWSPGAPALTMAPAIQGTPAVAMPGQPPGGEFISCPAVSARSLLSLGPGEFVLAVSANGPRLVELGRLVPARLPRGAASPGSLP